MVLYDPASISHSVFLLQLPPLLTWLSHISLPAALLAAAKSLQLCSMCLEHSFHRYSHSLFFYFSLVSAQMSSPQKASLKYS